MTGSCDKLSATISTFKILEIPCEYDHFLQRIESRIWDAQAKN